MSTACALLIKPKLDLTVTWNTSLSSCPEKGSSSFWLYAAGILLYFFVFPFSFFLLLLVFVIA